MYKNIFFILVVFIAVFYQNCGDISLAPTVKKAASQSLHGSFCSSMSSTERFRVEDFYIINLNGRVGSDGVFGADSDADGLLDKKERQLNSNFSLQYDPLKRRSYGILDSICYLKSSVDCAYIGSQEALGLGLWTNDFPSINGVDSDQDSLLDFAEILFQTDLLGSDDIPSDGDSLSNYEEVKRGSNPNTDSDENISADYLVSYIFYPVGSDSRCPNNQTLYEFELYHMPLAETLAFTSNNEPELSHAEKENIIWFYFISKNDFGEKEFYQTTAKISLFKSEIRLEPTDFHKIDSY